MSATQITASMDLTEEKKQIPTSLDDANKSAVAESELSLSLDGKKSELNETDFVYLKHATNVKVWHVSFTAAVHSGLINNTIIEPKNTESVGKNETNPLIIPNTIMYNTIPFNIKYMNFFNKKPEKAAPEEAPLKDLHLSDILGDEYELFKEFAELKMGNKRKIVYINEYIKTALYLEFQHLHKKFCAIISHIISNLSEKELQEVSQELQ